MSAKAGAAGIEYAGVPGVSKECQDAVLRLVQFGDRVRRVRILSSGSDHCLLLTVNVGDLIAIKSGFASGYVGEGSRAFSYVLEVLDTHGAEVDEFNVAADVIERLDSSSMTQRDLEAIEEAKPVRPPRWHNYVFEKHWEMKKNGTLWRKFPPVIPFAIIDRRIADLVISFWDAPDDKLLIGYRRLEDIVRERSGSSEHGTKLFAQAFAPTDGKLCWKNLDAGEQAGRMGLFTSAYQAYRNRRAHREANDSAEEVLTELLLLNHLYRLESDATETRSVAS